MPRTVRLLGREQLDWTASEMKFLAVGGVLVTACFFAGQNVGYRGILLLPALSGLVCLYRSVSLKDVRRFCGLMIAAVLFVMWEECLRRTLHAIVSPGPSEGLSSRAEVFFWLGRELVWWWLIVGLSALVLSYLRRPARAEDAVLNRPLEEKRDIQATSSTGSPIRCSRYRASLGYGSDARSL